MFGIVVHGGAGAISSASLGPERVAAHREALQAAIDAGYEVLSRGGSSLDAVQAAVVVLENSPLFNAGRGSVFTHEGDIEMDASIMDGRDGDAGAVASVRRIKNPIRAARAVLERSPHVMLAGEGAERFARQAEVEVAPQAYFHTDYRWQQLQGVRESGDIVMDHTSVASDPDKPVMDKFGTVGAVALDAEGNLAAATSTGGMTNKRWGRVGDSPLIGAGTYAKNATCAVSCTGHGEYFIREVIAYTVSARMAFAGDDLKTAAGYAIHEQLQGTEGRGGLIAIDHEGNIEMPFSTEGMFRGFRRSDGAEQIEI